MSKSTCTICSKTIQKFEEIDVLDQTWHRSCFKCGAGSNNGCGQSLSVESYREHDNIPYCSKCHISMKRNSVDREKVTSNTNNNTEERARSQPPLVKKPPPTTSPTHISRDIVDNIIKKKSAPLSPPPPMSPGGFKPKDISKLIAKSPHHHRDAKGHDSSSDSNSDSNSQSRRDSNSSDSNSDDEHIPPRKSLFPPKGRHTGNRRQGSDSDSDSSDDSNDSNSDKALPKKHTSKKNKSDTNNNTTTTNTAPNRAESKLSERDTNNESKNTNTNVPSKPSKSAIPKMDLKSTPNSKNKEIIFNFTKFLHSAKNRKLKAFLLSPVNRGITVRCYIERDRFGANMLG